MHLEDPAEQTITTDQMAEGLARARLLAQPTTREDLAAVVERVNEHREALGAAPDHDLSATLCDQLLALLADVADRFDDLEDDDVALARGAAEYYILGDDFEADDGPDGLADDQQVLIAVRHALNL